MSRNIFLIIPLKWLFLKTNVHFILTISLTKWANIKKIILVGERQREKPIKKHLRPGGD